jgi:glucose dehydrogenase (acceptor)
VTKILIDPSNKRVYGVEFIRDNTTHRVYARKEVVVSGGAVNSPQILLLSGVGPKEDLAPMGIPVIHDLPGVGKNLHNHVRYFVGFTINDTDTRALNWATAMEYLLFRDGLMSGTGISATTALVNTKYADPAMDHPDVQLLFGGYLADCAKTGQVGEIVGDKLNSSRHIIMFPTVLHTKSRGQIKLKSANPFDHPAIYANYLSEPEDVARLIEGIKFAMKLGETQALRRYGFKLDSTMVKGCEGFTFNTDEYWECAVRHQTMAENHQAGSCKMAPPTDPDSVVDSELRVYGVAGLRVADTSIMPTVTSGNTNAPAIMIAEKAADAIKSTWLSKRGGYQKRS